MEQKWCRLRQYCEFPVICDGEELGVRQLILASIIMSIIGISVFLIVLATYKMLLRENESGFLHLLMSFMYACWLPMPIVVYHILRDDEFLVVGTMFGVVSIVILILTMVLQASHLTYSATHHKEDAALWDKNDSWMIQGLLGGQVELLAKVFGGIWVMFVTASFWIRGYVLLGSFGIIFSLFTYIYLMKLIDSALVNKLRFLELVKLNYIVINLETFGWYLLLTVWLVLQL